MNRFFKYAPNIFAALILGFMVLSVLELVQSPFLIFEKNTPQPLKTYHYAFFLPSQNYSFFRKLREGALNASQTMDCAITFYELDNDPLSLDMVVNSGYDGIGIYPYVKDDRTLAALARISEAGIPVVQIENEILRDETTFFIGTNNFETGKAVGKLAMKAGNGKLNMALVYSEKNPGLMTDSNLIEMGLNSTMGSRLGNLHTRLTSLNPLDAEGLTYDLIRGWEDLDIIILTDPNDTLVAVQAIIDLNMVGSVQVIGFGEDERIQEYINKGLMLGTIVRNPFRIGFSAVMALQEISTNGYTSAYVDTGISVLLGKLPGGENK
ncbi:substrate-binding domain-containing protein [Spirochaeta isovalerica]|uniref:Ribose transport system substrate-binding protein n=1 Tax=Spirochaeta isovalerica TaxID=150 RepID=A0A841RH15_9SPIO|nr:ribose transport system substrate-binding protein [Spirochaeta isovalerica]